MTDTANCTGQVISESYELEYGTDCLEMHVGAVQPGERALVIDDLVATGGTLSAAIRLLGMLCDFVIDTRILQPFFPSSYLLLSTISLIYLDLITTRTSRS